MLLFQSHTSCRSADSWCWRCGPRMDEPLKHGMLILTHSRGAILRECAFCYTALKVACTGRGICHLSERDI